MAMQEPENSYNILYSFRNICCPVLAELFAKDLKNSKYIEDLSVRGGTESRTLFETLKHVNSIGERLAQKKSSGMTQEVVTGTCTVKNIKENEKLLKQVLTEELLKEGEASEAVTKLKRLDVKFLVCLLINNVLKFPHNSEVRKALEKILDLRNSSFHQDQENEVLQKVLDETKILYNYLGKNNASFQKIEEWFFFPSNNCCQMLKDIQQEINSSYQMLHHNHQHQQTIIHQQFKEHCQEGEIVENLVEFLREKQVSSCQEPCPIVLCGEPGAGKSSIMHGLAHTITQEQASKDFLMVVKVDDIKTTSKHAFWKQLFTCLTNLSPQAVEKHGLDNVRRVLSSYTNRFLFLMDHNLQDTKSLNHLMPYLDRGTWVLSYQVEPEPSIRFHLLKVAPLSEEQVHLVMQDITMSEADRQLVSEFYKKCEYKEIIKTTDMVHIFAEICSELKSCVPFYKIIQHYIYKRVDRTAENETKLIELGEKAFHTIRKNKKYYPISSLNSTSQPFLQHNHLEGCFFKYRKVEEYLAAKYIVANPEVACKFWLSQAQLFKTVFLITCALWSEQDNGIHSKLNFIRAYLKKVFEMKGSQKRKGKKRKLNATTSEVDDDANQNTFERWIYLSKAAKDNHSNKQILCLLADLLSGCNVWLFKFTSLTEDLINSLSLVLRYVRLTKKLTIQMECGTDVEILSQLWSMLSSHSKLWHDTSVHLVIRYTESNLAPYELVLAQFCAKIYNTTAPLYITEYTGPLLLSETPMFFECSCMTKLHMLDVHICDLTSLGKVLEQKYYVRNINIRLKLNTVNTSILDTLRIRLSSFFPPVLTICYFEGLQILLDSFEKPESLCSLRIYKVYINKSFYLDLTRFTKLKFLSLQFDQKTSEENILLLPFQEWTSHLGQHLHLPTHVGRLMMKNMSFFDDFTAPDLVQYLKKLKFQRLVLLDTKLSIPKFREILQSFVSSSGIADTVEHMNSQTDESPALPPKEIVKRQRLNKAERETRRQNKPEGKELIITSEADLFPGEKCSTYDWESTYHNFASAVKEVYLCQALNINFSGKFLTIRKDVCGDLSLQCPLPHLNDKMAQNLEGPPDLGPVFEALALAQVISINHTHLSYGGALCLLQHLKERMRNFGEIEPYRITIFSRLRSNCSKSEEEVPSNFLREIRNDGSLQQFNFRCSCEMRCCFFKKAIDGSMFFNGRPWKAQRITR